MQGKITSVIILCRSRQCYPCKCVSWPGFWWAHPVDSGACRRLNPSQPLSWWSQTWGGGSRAGSVPQWVLVPPPLAQKCCPSDLWCLPLVSASALLVSVVLISHAWQPSRVSWLSTPWSRTLLSLLLTQQSLLIEFIFVWIALVSVAWIFIRFNRLSLSSYVIPTVSAPKLECLFTIEGKGSCFGAWLPFSNAHPVLCAIKLSSHTGDH